MYRLTPDPKVVQRTSDGGFITLVNPDNNPAYQQYLEWLAVEGNAPEPLPAPKLTREEQKEEINRERDAALQAGVMFMGELHHSDDTFKSDLNLMIMGYDKGLISGLQNIRTKTNKIVQLNYTQIIQLLLTIGQTRQAILADSWTRKDAIDNLPPEEEPPPEEPPPEEPPPEEPPPEEPAPEEPPPIEEPPPPDGEPVP